MILKKKTFLLTLLMSTPIFSMIPPLDQVQESQKSFPLNDYLFKNMKFTNLLCCARIGNLKEIKHFFENYPRLIYTKNSDNETILDTAIEGYIKFGKEANLAIVTYILNQNFQIHNCTKDYLNILSENRYFNDRKKTVRELIENNHTPIQPEKITTNPSSLEQSGGKEENKNSNPGEQTTKSPHNSSSTDEKLEENTYFTRSNAIKLIGGATIVGLLYHFWTKDDQKNKNTNTK